MTTADLPALLLAAGSVAIIAAIALAPLLAPARDLAEANPEPRANPAPTPTGADSDTPPPACSRTICAWCHPGIDHPAGHGICPAHAADLIAQAERAERLAQTDTRNFSAE